MVPNVKDVIEAGYAKCSGCGTPTLAWNDPCWECVKARAKAAHTHRCTCPAKLKRPREVSNGIRRWVACDRCLGTINQLPDPPRRTK